MCQTTKVVVGNKFIAFHSDVPNNSLPGMTKSICSKKSEEPKIQQTFVRRPLRLFHK